MTREEAIIDLNAIKFILDNDQYTDEIEEALDTAIFALQQPEPKKGRWIDKSNGIEGAWNYCSVCGEQAIDLYDFCPNCGADMRGEQDG